MAFQPYGDQIYNMFGSIEAAQINPVCAVEMGLTVGV
jgi:hypothetical protein